MRHGCGYLGRRRLSHARGEEHLTELLEWVRCFYHFIRPHRALQFGKMIRTPAMQAGLVARRLPFRDIFRSTATNVIYASDNNEYHKHRIMTIIIWLQALSPHDLFRLIFSAITWCGDGPLYFLIFPVLYWAKSPAIAVRYGYLWGLSVLVMTVLKEQFGILRPFVVAPELVEFLKYPLEGLYRFASQEALLDAYRQSPAFPSGHALFSAALGMYLHAQTAVQGVRWLLVFFVVMIPVSRLYLGVHYPADVLTGSGVGLMLFLGVTEVRWSSISQSLSDLGIGRWQRHALLGVLAGPLLALLSKNAFMIWLILMSYPLVLTFGEKPIRVLAAEHEASRWCSHAVCGCVGVGLLLWVTASLRSVGTLLCVPLVTVWVALGSPLLVKTIYKIMGSP